MNLTKKHLMKVALLFVIVSFGPTTKDSANAQEAVSSKPILDTSAWRTYNLANSSFANWEIKFPKSFKCPQSRSGPCNPSKIDGTGKVVLGESSLTLCSEDYLDDVALPAAYCISVDSPKRWSSTNNFFGYLKAQISQTENNGILRIGAINVSNGRTMLKVETVSGDAYIDRYFIEVDESRYIRISVRKYKPDDVLKRTQEIETIISSFNLMN